MMVVAGNRIMQRAGKHLPTGGLHAWNTVLGHIMLQYVRAKVGMRGYYDQVFPYLLLAFVLSFHLYVEYIAPSPLQFSIWIFPNLRDHPHVPKIMEIFKQSSRFHGPQKPHSSLGTSVSSKPQS